MSVELSPAPFVDLTLTLFSLANLVAAAEDLTAYHAFGDRRLLSWNVHRLRSSWTAGGWSGTIANRLFNYRTFQWLIIVRVIAAAWLLFATVLWAPRSVLLGLLTLSTLGYNVRSPYGLDGSHQMLVVIALPLFLASILPTENSGWSVALWFIGAQSCLSYASAGTAKLTSSEWRSGQAIAGIMRTEMYGNAWLHRVATRTPSAGRALGWCVMVFESAFPLALLGPIEVTLAILGAGLAFHFANALFMGLNVFFVAFVASYPALVYLAMCM